MAASAAYSAYHAATSAVFHANARPAVRARASCRDPAGHPAVEAERASAKGEDLQQTAGHGDVLQDLMCSLLSYRLSHDGSSMETVTAP
jgi:hypothetical protein